jgi:hypothetical protein
LISLLYHDPISKLPSRTYGRTISKKKNIWKENAMLQIFYRIQRGKIKANIWNEERILEEKSPKRRKLHGFNFNVPYRWILFHEAS